MQFDAVLISFGVLTAVLESAFETNAGSLSTIMVLRVLRLLKLARALRLFSQFKVMWMLVRGLLTSLQTMCYTFVLMFLIIYLFANLAIEITTKDTTLRLAEPAFDALVSQYFPDLFTSMVTLVHLGNEGGGGFLYAQLIPFKPVQITCFFVTFILVVCISLMNLITAVVVEGALDKAAQDKEAYMAYKVEAMKDVMPQIAALFCELDTNGDHLVTHDEIEFAQRHVQERLGKILEMDDLTELFEILDNDNSGELDIDEFVCGICKIVTTNSTLDQVRMEKNISLIRKEMKDVRYYVERTEDNLRREIRESHNLLLREIREVHNLLLKPNLNHENLPLLQVAESGRRLSGAACATRGPTGRMQISAELVPIPDTSGSVPDTSGY